MKKLILFAGAVLFSFSAIQAQSSIKSLPIGSEIPLLTNEYPSVNRKNISLQKMQTQNGLLVMFSCNTCPYVIKAQERTREIQAFAAEKGIGMVIVNSNHTQRDGDDSPRAMLEYAKQQGYKAPYLIDENSALANAFGATRTPEVFLFDKEGKLVYKGAMEDNPSEPKASGQLFLRNAIENMLSGKKIEPNSTKSIGCTIKRAG